MICLFVTEVMLNCIWEYALLLLFTNTSSTCGHSATVFGEEAYSYKWNSVIMNPVWKKTLQSANIHLRIQSSPCKQFSRYVNLQIQLSKHAAVPKYEPQLFISNQKSLNCGFGQTIAKNLYGCLCFCFPP